MLATEWLRRAGKIEGRINWLSRELAKVAENYEHLLGYLWGVRPPRAASRQAAVRAARPVSPLRRPEAQPFRILQIRRDSDLVAFEFDEGTTVV